MACLKEHREILQVLLKNGADPNVPNIEGLSPLHITISKGNLEMTKLLVEFNASIEVPYKTLTPLHCSIEQGNLEIIKFLLEKGAEQSPIGTYHSGNEEKLVTPLDIALQKGDKQIISLLLSYSNIKPNRFLTLSKLRLPQLNIEEFPKGLVQLSCLTKLDLSNNPITEIPNVIGEMTNLREIDFSHTELENFPNGICNISSLSKLNLNFTKISEIPSCISKLTRLERLELTNNQLVALPEELGHLTRLKKLLLDGNPLHGIPKEMISRGTPRLLEYLKHISGCSADWKKIKLMVVGEVCVGKTSLLRSLKLCQLRTSSMPTLRRSKKDKDKDLSSNISTDGIDVSELILDDLVTVSAWDFGGQEVKFISIFFFFLF